MSKVIPLLGEDGPTRHVALQALLIVAHHGGLPVVEELATYNGLLTKLIHDYSDDEHTPKMAIAVLASINWFIFCQVDPPSSSLTKRMSLPDVIRTAIAMLRAPLNPERSVLLHALHILVAPTEQHSDECRANPSLMSVLAAVTRSKSLSARITAVYGLMGVHQSKSDSERTRFRLLEVLRSSSLKQHLGRLLLGTGWSYTIDLVKDLNAYTLLLKKLAQPTCDLYAVGKGLADLVQRQDYVVSELLDDRNTGRDSVYFPEWLEQFISCTRELRTRAASDADRDLADVLEMKVLILRGRVTEAKALGRRAIVRNPGLAYAYYVVARGPPTEEGLRVAKLGLRCSCAPSFTRSQLLWVSLEFAARIGLTVHGISDDSDPRVLSLFSSALKDARTFMAEVPWDHPSTRIVVSWTILLIILLQRPGHEQELKASIGTQTAWRTNPADPISHSRLAYSLGRSPSSQPTLGTTTLMCNCDELKNSSVKNTIAVSTIGTIWWTVSVAETWMPAIAPPSWTLTTSLGLVSCKVARAGRKDPIGWAKTSSTGVHGAGKQVHGRRSASGVTLRCTFASFTVQSRGGFH